MIKQPSIDVTQDPGLHRNPIVQQIVKPIVPFSIPKYHWVADTPDPRDLIYQVSTSIATPPATVDLRSHCSPIDDQGQLGSCTGNAIAGAIDYLDYKSGKPDRVSRLFIYYYERLIENTVNYDSGAQIRDGIKATYTYGVPQESLWPYNINQFKTKPSTAAIADAARRKVTQYQRALDFNAVKNALQNGYPVTIGFTVYSSFESGNWWYTTGNMPYPNVNREAVLGGHAVLIVGYNDTTQRFIVRNSWGTGWGDKGYFYMPYQVIQNVSMSSDFWVINAVSNP